MRIGYARVSTQDQTLDPQLDLLKENGCEKIFTDVVSGVRADRPGLLALKSYVRAGDTVVVVRLDRMGRSLKDLVLTVEDFEKRDIKFVSLNENIDTVSSTGKLIFHLFTALAEFERNLIKERTVAGLKSARARGRVGGRRFKLTAPEVKMLKALYESQKISVSDIAAKFKITRRSVYNYLELEGCRDVKQSEFRGETKNGGD